MEESIVISEVAKKPKDKKETEKKVTAAKYKCSSYAIAPSLRK